jgi:hypothetical protein
MTLNEAVRIATRALREQRDRYDDWLRQTQSALARAEDAEYKRRIGPAEVANYERWIAEIDAAIIVLHGTSEGERQERMP